MYEVSNTGLVRSIDRVINSSFAAQRTIKGKVLKPMVSRSGKGYYMVDLNKNGSRKMSYVHRLVSDAFLEKESLNEVNHIDGNTLNNNVGNLEWCTHKENMVHAYKTGLADCSHINQKGDKCGASKLNSDMVIEIKKRLKKGDSALSISKSINVVGVSAIREIKAGRSWAHISV